MLARAQLAGRVVRDGHAARAKERKSAWGKKIAPRQMRAGGTSQGGERRGAEDTRGGRAGLLAVWGLRAASAGDVCG